MRCQHKEADGFHVCGSYAFNLHRDGIDQGNLCDVHYWEAKYELVKVERDAALMDARRYHWLRLTTNKFTNSSGERIDVKLAPEEWDRHIDNAIKEQP